MRSADHLLSLLSSWRGTATPAAPTGELLLAAVEGLLAAQAATDLGDFLAAFDPMEGVDDSLLRPLRGIVCVSLAGLARLLRKSQILRFHLSGGLNLRVYQNTSRCTATPRGRANAALEARLCPRRVADGRPFLVLTVVDQ